MMEFCHFFPFVSFQTSKQRCRFEKGIYYLSALAEMERRGALLKPGGVCMDSYGRTAGAWVKGIHSGGENG